MKYRLKTIHSLTTSGGDAVNEEKHKRHIYEHFRELFGRARNRRIKFLKDMWPPQDNLLDLEKNFTEDEIKKAIWDLGKDKALGLDGFPIFFFQIFWSTIKEDLLNLFKKLYNGDARLDRLSYFFIVLIPKRDSLESISEYRPIALLNSVLKFFFEGIGVLSISVFKGDDRQYIDRLHRGTKYPRRYSYCTGSGSLL